MARIPDEELQRIKSQVKVEDLCREYGIELKRMGPDNLMGCCPFHDDRTPSFGVTPSKNLWNCLAGCGGGDTIQLVMKKEGVSFRQAAEVLRQRLGVAPPAAPMIKTRMGTTHAALVENATDLADHVLLRHVMDFYHQTFCNDIKAMRYLEERRCFNAEATKLFLIGYANRTLGYRIPPAKTAAGNALEAQLQRLGVLRESGHEHLNGCVVFPILDEHGNVAQMYGRKITPNLREGTPLHLYLPGEHRAVWNATALRRRRTERDIAVRVHHRRADLVVCGIPQRHVRYGVNGFTNAHWQLIEEIKPKRIVNCYDNDDAGNPAAARLAPQLVAKGITVVRAKLPPGKDINDVACMNKDARVALAIALETPAEIAGMDGPIVITSTATSDEAAKEKAPAPPVESPSPLAAIPVVVPTETAKEKKSSTVTPLAASSPTDALAKPATDADETFFNFGPRQWRVRGVGKNLAFETLRVQLRVLVQSGEQYSFHLDSLDLCNAKHRQSFISQAQAETRLDENLLKRDLGQVFLKVEELQEKCIRQATEPKQKEVIVPDAERKAAMELLKDPKLLDRILADFDRCGVVGEEINKLVGYLAAVSRKLERFHKTIKTECIRPGTPLSLDDARRLVGQYVTHYNAVRLHSAVGYVTPADMLAGRDKQIHADRDLKLNQARQERQKRREADRPAA